jgi:hypothetical protein
MSFTLRPTAQTTIKNKYSKATKGVSQWALRKCFVGMILWGFSKLIVFPPIYLKVLSILPLNLVTNIGSIIGWGAQLKYKHIYDFHICPFVMGKIELFWEVFLDDKYRYKNFSF